MIEAHILAAAMTVFNMKTLDDSPSHEIFNIPADANSLQRRDVLLQATSLLVNELVDITFVQGDETRKRKERNQVPTLQIMMEYERMPAKCST